MSDKPIKDKPKKDKPKKELKIDLNSLSNNIVISHKTNVDNLSNVQANDLTLQYLINPMLYEKLQLKKLSQEETNTDFYKERILNATQSLLNKKDTDYQQYPEIKQIFQQYCKILISHFIQEDTTDIFQSHLAEHSNNKKFTTNPEQNGETSHNTQINTQSIIDINTQLYNVPKDKCMDNFVIKTNIISSAKHILPIIKNINISTLEHKYKGIR